MYGHLEIVQLLLRYGADIHTCEDIALHWASANGRHEVVRFLFQRGSNMITRANSSLYQASTNGHAEVVRLILPHISDPDVNYALYCASKMVT